MRVIRTAGELSTLARDRRVNGLGVREPIAFDIPALSRHRQLRAERLLNRYQRRCGCSAGAVFFIAALVVGAIHLTGAAEGLSPLLALHALALVGVAFAVGFAAKIAVLALTRMQFSFTCRRLARELSAAGLEAEAGA